MKQKKKKTYLLKMSSFSYLEYRLVNYSPRAKASPLPVAVNKVLLEYRQAHSFTHCPWQLLCFEGKMY